MWGSAMQALEGGSHRSNRGRRNPSGEERQQLEMEEWGGEIRPTGDQKRQRLGRRVREGSDGESDG